MKSAVVFLVVLLASIEAHSATRRLATDCSVAADFVPTEAQPLDLDACTLVADDDISLLLTDIASRWGRLRSRTLEVGDCAGGHDGMGDRGIW